MNACKSEVEATNMAHSQCNTLDDATAVSCPNTFTNNTENIHAAQYNAQHEQLVDAGSNYQLAYGHSNVLPFVGSYPANGSYVMGGQVPSNSSQDPNVFQQCAPNTMYMAPSNMYPQMQMQDTGNAYSPHTSSNVVTNAAHGYPSEQSTTAQIALFVDSATGMQYIGEKIGNEVKFTPHPGHATPQFLPMQNTTSDVSNTMSPHSQNNIISNNSNHMPITHNSNISNTMPINSNISNHMPMSQNTLLSPISPCTQNNSPKKGKKMLYRNSSRTILPAANGTQRNTESLLVPVEPVPHGRKIRKKVVVNQVSNCTRALLPAKRSNHQMGPEIICWTCRKTFENDEARFRAHYCYKSTKERRSYCTRCFKTFCSVEEYYSHICMTSDHLFNCNICDARFKTVEFLSKHSEVHTQMCVFNCEVCSLGFQSQMLLDNHMQSHYTTPNHMQSHYTTPNHMQSHYTTPNHMQPHYTAPNHMQSHYTTPQTYIYACTICSTTFPSRQLYDTHMAVSHNLNTQNCATSVVPPSAQISQNYAQVADPNMLGYQGNPYMSNIMYNSTVMPDGTVTYSSSVPAVSNDNILGASSAMSCQPPDVSAETAGREMSDSSALTDSNNQTMSGKNIASNFVSDSYVQPVDNKTENSGVCLSAQVAECMSSQEVNVVPKPEYPLTQALFDVQNGDNEIKEEGSETNDNQFSCNICHFTFQSTKDLSEHLCSKVSHNCGYCGKIFSGKYASRRYTKHLEIHPSELTFSCPLCPQKFRTSRQLKFHSKKHVNAAKLYCNLCNLSFKTVEALASHDKIHKHMKACFACPVCSAKFIYERTLNKHLKDIHHARVKRDKEIDEECTDDVA